MSEVKKRPAKKRKLTRKLTSGFNAFHSTITKKYIKNVWLAKHIRRNFFVVLSFLF